MAAIADLDTTKPAEFAHPYRPLLTARKDDTDELYDLLQAVTNEAKTLFAVAREIKEEIGRKAERIESDKLTRRLVGEKYKLKVVLPGETVDQSVLKQCLAEYPDFAEDVVKPSTYKVHAKDLKKIASSSGTEAFEEFKRLILTCKKPSTSPPTVTLDK